jgi:hypothetical protein
LALSATSGAAAALLRQRSPQLQQFLAAEGCEFTGIRVRVQARSMPARTEKPVKKQLDEQVCATLYNTAAELGDSPWRRLCSVWPAAPVAAQSAMNARRSA